MSPEWLVRLPPYNLIPNNLSTRVQVPEELTVVSQLACINRDVLRCAGSLGKRPNDSTVHFGHTTDKIKVAEFGKVSELFSSAVDAYVLVLMSEVLIRLSETGGDESLVKERLVVSTSKVSVESVDDAHYIRQQYTLES